MLDGAIQGLLDDVDFGSELRLFSESDRSEDFQPCIFSYEYWVCHVFTLHR